MKLNQKYLKKNVKISHGRTRPISYGTIFNFQFWLLFFLLPLSAHAAELSILAPTEVKVGETFITTVLLDTSGAAINSASVSVAYPEDLLTFAGYLDEGSIIQYWVKAPTEEGDVISLEGVIPGGVSGVYDPAQKGLAEIPLVRLRFTAETSGQADFTIEKSLILLNDGSGSALPHTKKNANLTIKNEPIESAAEIDKIPPLSFNIDLVEGSLFSRTPTLLVFSTSDTDSGVKTYEIKIGAGGWREAKSPEPVSRGFFSRNIIVRAYDFYGNFQEANITLPGIFSSKFLLTILIVIMSGILGYKMLKSKT